MAYPLSLSGVASFTSYLADKGLVPTASAAAMRTACERVFSALSPDERENLAGVDVSAAVQRFMNKNPGVLSPESAAVYRSRVQRALEMLTRYNNDPVSFRPAAAKRNNGSAPAQERPSSTRASRRPASGSAVTGVDAATVAKQESAVVVGAMTLTLPLRSDFVAQFIVPRDLTTKEARRLGAYFATVAVDYEPPP